MWMEWFVGAVLHNDVKESYSFVNHLDEISGYTNLVVLLTRTLVYGIKFPHEALSLELGEELPLVLRQFIFSFNRTSA
jgi:hypothetical protein